MEGGGRNPRLPFSQSTIKWKEHGFKDQITLATNPNCATLGRVFSLLKKQNELVNFPRYHYHMTTSSYGPQVHTTVMIWDIVFSSPEVQRKPAHAFVQVFGFYL